MSTQSNILQPRFQSGFGDECHMKGSGYIPVCVITDLNNKILVRNMETGDKRNKWLTAKARVTINRFWTSSNAVVRCTIASEDLGADFPDIGQDQKIARFINQNNPPAAAAGAPTLGSTLPQSTTEIATPTTTPSSIVSRPVNVRGGTPASTQVVARATTANPSRTQQEGLQESDGPLEILDEICIYMGYIDALRPVTQEDITAGRLKRVFIGVIDTITASGTNREGTNILIQCRDRMRYLMDSLGTFNTADLIDLRAALTNQGEPVDSNADPTQLRSDAILTIARRAIGDLRNSAAITSDADKRRCDFVGGVGIDVGIVVDFSGPQGTKASAGGVAFDLGADASPYFIYLPSSDNPERSISGDKTSYKEKPSSVLKFNIITGRPGYKTNDIKYNFQVTDRVPVEYIKYLSNQEPWPTELFAHHQTGEYWYAPRGTDVSGFDDPTRFYRTYFYRRYPGDLKLKKDVGPPHICQMCLSFREERSAISWRSNIIVTGARASESPQDAQAVHIVVKPSWLKDKPLPVSYYTATDPTAGSGATLGALAFSLARTIGKEVKAATARFIGDPTFCPGEAVLIMGSPLNKDPITNKQLLDDVKLAKDIRDSYSTVVKNIAEQIRADTGAKAGDPANDFVLPENKATSPAVVKPAEAGIVVSSKLFCPALFEAVPNAEPGEVADAADANLPAEAGNNNITFAPEPRSVWRVEGLTHFYNEGEAGYFTEVSLLSPF
jgi:hypothetical protein